MMHQYIPTEGDMKSISLNLRLGLPYNLSRDNAVEFRIKREFNRRHRMVGSSPLSYNAKIYFKRLYERVCIINKYRDSDYYRDTNRFYIFNLEGKQQSIDLSREIKDFLTPVVRTDEGLRRWFRKISGNKQDISRATIKTVSDYIKSGVIKYSYVKSSILSEIKHIELLLSFMNSLIYTMKLYPSDTWTIEVIRDIVSLLKSNTYRCFSELGNIPSKDTSLDITDEDILAARGIRSNVDNHPEEHLNDFLTMLEL